MSLSVHASPVPTNTPPTTVVVSRTVFTLSRPESHGPSFNHEPFTNNLLIGYSVLNLSSYTVNQSPILRVQSPPFFLQPQVYLNLSVYQPSYCNSWRILRGPCLLEDIYFTNRAYDRVPSDLQSLLLTVKSVLPLPHTVRFLHCQPRVSPGPGHPPTQPVHPPGSTSSVYPPSP